ncbi:HIT family protein [Jatrophihabitans sp. DSM 45814]
MADPDDCPFCAIVSGREPARIVYTDNDAVAFLPLNPAARGHCLVVPRVHIADFFALDGPAAGRLSTAVLEVAKAVELALNPEGMNLIASAGAAAQQTIFHLHVHVLPRMTSDRIGDIWPSAEAASAKDADDIQALIAAAVRSRSRNIGSTPPSQPAQ